MTRALVACLAVLAVLPVTAASAKSITCSYAAEQELTFVVPKKIGGVPQIDFDYPSKITNFSFRDGNLFLMAVDESEKDRLRLVISAQQDKQKSIYAGQIVTDAGGNQLMIDNGPVTCKVKD